ncbi:SDR family NAD(P)-dependent oxidoreductase [Mycolicibacterium arenosum]|uniref:SDR family NAD(P)-dependent oxidoreductase n=1 Tax=Mycolicibacterium arenosum TaxID=2952157 RepID=A0ABT1M205_9MYCO|nr:SDR family NAD(P)-dependent oxidoreductase [Mycolicibacterium sp. CAU 1645]MCP9273184.1 SDR family NAD(P)-dependent oxidoreductase [Mycolicibacterium sp. CAU 1645]
MTTQQDVPQVVIVIGASSGIGKETALHYSRRGCRLVLAARSDDTLQAVAEQCRLAGAAEVAVQITDIGISEQVHELFDVAVARFGRVDVAAQCAAVTAFGRFEDIPTDVFDGVVMTNLLGAANVARAALSHFREREAGHLVLVGSLLGVMAVPNQSPYVLSKFAVSALVRVLRQENRDLPAVRIHGIYPGPVSTPVYGTAGNYLGYAPKVPPTADAPGVVAAAIVRATDRRRSSERQVGLINRPAILAFRLIPAIFDAVIGPLMRAVSFESEPIASTAGNVFGVSAAEPTT